MAADAHKVLVKAAHLYYREQLTQAEIGARLGLSRHKVGRLLREALASGTVRVEIRSPYTQTVELERELEAALGLKAAVIVDAEGASSAAELKRQVCKAGAAFLERLVGDGATVGIGWGSTTYELVTRLPSHERRRGSVVQITGGNKWLSAEFDCHAVTRRLAEKLGFEAVLLHAPGIVEHASTRDVLLAEPSIAETFGLFDRLDVAVVGIGALVPEIASTLVTSGYVAAAELEALLAAGAVGDVFSYFIGGEGRLIATPLHERLITIGIERIRRLPWSIGVATGPVKARAVRAAVLGGFVNVLVIDSRLAADLLALSTGTAATAIASIMPAKAGRARRPAGAQSANPRASTGG